MMTNLSPPSPLLKKLQQISLKYPQKTAIIHNEKKINYSDLWELVGTYHNIFTTLDLNPGDKIGISCHRSIDTVALLLACLTKGIVFIPLDENYLPHRIEEICKLSNPFFVITQDPEQLAYLSSIKRISLPTFKTLAPSPSEILSSSRESTLACVLYTSGSTGKPKGVWRTHQALFTQLSFLMENEKENSEHIVAQISSLNFIPSLVQIIGSLMVGATLAIIDEHFKRDPLALIKKCNQNGVTKISLVPSLFELILETLSSEAISFASLKKITCTGEALDPSWVEKHFFLQPHIQLINTYGSTETGGIGYYIYDAGLPSKDPCFTLYPHVQVKIVDKNRKEVPPGTLGEIGVISAAVGNYDKRKFHQDSSLFPTGDFGYINGQNQLVLQGRSDNQVKLYGQRVHLEEIVLYLKNYPGIKKGVALLDTHHKEKVVFFFTATHHLKHSSLQEFAQKVLPSALVPSSYVQLPELPLLPNGKIDRGALLSFSLPRPTAEEETPSSSLIEKLLRIWSAVLGVPSSHIPLDSNFFDLGGNSFLTIKLVSRVKKCLPETNLTFSDVFQYPTIRDLATFLTRENRPPSESGFSKLTFDKKGSSKDIALIGLACRFPGASTPEEYWDNLEKGKVSITYLPQPIPPHFSSTTFFTQEKDPLIPAFAQINDMDKFDHHFFGFTDLEAKWMDPQQRLLLETTFHALENAGYSDPDTSLKKGIFIGASDSKYFLYNILLNGLIHSQTDFNFAHVLNSTQFLATRLAYKLNIKGPALTINTACSTSLAAVALACESLRNKQCDLAIAGGINLKLPDDQLNTYQPDGILSPDGICRPFDHKANGTIFGSGMGVVVMKRLDQAIADKDPIVAVIKGFSINNDGSHKIGFSAPSKRGHMVCIQEAIEDARINVRSLHYLEGHGTATKRGDPIEFAALSEALSLYEPHKKNFCALGSVKGNIGHLNIAAGVAGFIKAALCVKNNTIIPEVRFERPNPSINLQDSPFFISNKSRPLSDSVDGQRTAAVSSLGMGGTNVHVILQEAPSLSSPQAPKSYHILALSAKDPLDLTTKIKNLISFMEKPPTSDSSHLQNLEYSLWMNQQKFPCRKSIVCSTIQEAKDLLSSSLLGPFCSLPSSLSQPDFFFSSTSPCPFTLSLYKEIPSFRRYVDVCWEEVVRLNLEKSPQHIYIKTFITQYSLLCFLRDVGIHPKSCKGAALGRLVVDCAAGRISVAECLQIITSEQPYELSGKEESYTLCDEDPEFKAGEIPPSQREMIDLGLSSIGYFHPQQDFFYICQIVAKQWEQGHNLLLEKLMPYGRKIPLPSYPFKRLSHWLERHPNPNTAPLKGEDLQPKGNLQESTSSRLLRIWHEVFQRPDISLKSNFYDLGGHSLLALQLVSQINRKFGISFLTSQLLETSTIEALANLIDQQGPPSSITPSPRQVTGEVIFPLSFAQRRMWLLEEAHKSSHLCLVPIAIKVEGKVSAALLSQSLRWVMKKHPILRSHLVIEKEEVKQIIKENFSLEIINEQAQTAEELHPILEKYKNYPFNIYKEILFKCILIRMPHESVLLFVFHHLLIDSFSSKLFLDDLSKAYATLRETKTLPDCVVDGGYQQFVLYQQEEKERQEWKDKGEKWKMKLEDFSPLSLPKKSLYLNITPSLRAKCIPLEIDDPDLLDQIHQLCIRHKCTPFILFLSLFMLLLFYYSGKKDISTLSFFANREKEFYKDTIGLFANPQVMALSLEEIDSFSSLIQKTKTMILEAMGTQDFPFEVLKQHLLPEINLDLLGTTIFLFQEGASRKSFLGHKIEEILHVHPQSILQDLCLEVINRTDHIQFHFLYNEELFDESIIHQMGHNYLRLLHSLLQNPELSPKNISLSDTLYLSSSPPSGKMPDISSIQQTLYDLFSQQVKNYPYHIALVTEEGKEITFLGLSQMVNRFSQLLLHYHVRPQDIVGLSLPPSFELIASILAILKIGGIYLPLDSSYPLQRLLHYVSHSRARFIITNDSLYSSLFKEMKFEGVFISVDQPFSLSEEKGVSPSSNPIAAIFYTSGSTGDPKGVKIRQESIINRCVWFQKTFQLLPKDVCCLSTSLNFIDSIPEIFCSLLGGSKLLLVNRDKIKNLKTFLSLLETHKVTRLVVVPSLLEVIVSSKLSHRYLQHMETITCSGEVLPAPLAQRFVKSHPHIRLLNFYGSTEVMADVTFFEVSPSLQLNSIPIGKEIDNVNIYILNDEGAVLPTGAVGTLYVGGICLADGYLHNPSKSEESFKAFSIEGKEAILYNTHDRALRTLGGDIVYLGRNDRIIKIHGNTIDLVEIESCLLQTTLVLKAVSFLQEKKEVKQLIACIIPADSTTPSEELTQKILAVMKQRLPSYMIPHKIIIVDQFPLTPNGKVDIKQLVSSSAMPSKPVVNSKTLTPLQEEILSIWQKLLDTNEIGIYTHFFEEGGSSLLLMKLLIELEKAFQVTLNVSDIIPRLTIEGLSLLIRSCSKNPSLQKGSNLVIFPPITGISKDYAPIIPLLKDHSVVTPLYPFDQASHFSSVEDLVHYYESTLTLDKDSPLQLMGYSMGGILALACAHQLSQKGYFIKRVIMIDTYYPHPSFFTPENKNKEKNRIKDALDNALLKEKEIRSLMPVVLHNLILLSKYKMPPYSGEIHLLHTKTYPAYLQSLWEKQYSAFSCSRIEGEHFTIFRSPHLEKNGPLIKRALHTPHQPRR